MSRKISTILFILILITVPLSCKKKLGIKGIFLDITFSDEKLSDDLLIEIQYIWKTDEKFIKMSQDYNVFVNFWHKNNLLCYDDHIPEISTSSWEPEKDYTYSRRIYIPPFIDEFDPGFRGEETLKLSIGFFSPYERSGELKQEILKKKLRFFPSPFDSPEIIYEKGWYNLEINPETSLKQWRWTAKQARCIIDNPHRDSLLVIRGGVNLDALDDQKVIFKINDLILDEFIPEKFHFEKSFNIMKEMFGERNKFYLGISTDKTFIPAKIFPDSTDERELGIHISFIYIR